MPPTLAYASSRTAPKDTSGDQAMLLGIVGLVMSLLVIGGPLGLVAIFWGAGAIAGNGRRGRAIAGIATGVVAVAVSVIALQFWFAFLTGPFPTSRRNGTLAEIANLKSAVETFQVDNGRLPDTAESLDALVVCPPDLTETWTRQLDAVPADKWGRPYIYEGPDRRTDGSFNIRSAGPDGIFGTTDDIDKSTRR